MRRSFSLLLDNWRSTLSFLMSLSNLETSSSLEALILPERPPEPPPEAAEDLPLREASLGAPALLTWLLLDERFDAVADEEAVELAPDLQSADSVTEATECWLSMPGSSPRIFSM